MKDDRLYLIHISECIGRIEQYVAGGRDAFMESTLIQDAVVRNLQILTESTQRLSDAFKSTHQEVPWRDLAGFRNVLFTTTWESIRNMSGRSSSVTSPV